jgi:hypothetical protein
MRLFRQADTFSPVLSISLAPRVVQLVEAGRCRWPRSMTEGARFLHHPKAGPASWPTPRSGPTPTTAAGWPATERLDGVHGLRTAHWPSWVIPLCHADIRYTAFAYQGNDGVWRQTLPSGRQHLAGLGLQIGGSSHGCGIVSLHRLRLLLGMVEVRVEGLAALRDPNQPSGRCWPLHERGSPWPNGRCGRGIDQTGTAGHVNLTSEAPEPRERPTTPNPNVANTTGQRCARRSRFKLRWIGDASCPGRSSSAPPMALMRLRMAPSKDIRSQASFPMVRKSHTARPRLFATGWSILIRWSGRPLAHQSLTAP